MCREHLSHKVITSAHVGSSPRVQGTRIPDHYWWQLVRFIPACAGNTPTSVLLLGVVTVHPRVCREHGMTGRPLMAVIGSSPRVQGTLLGIVPDTPPWRFIPACAGNTTGANGWPGCSTVHPRVCREHRTKALRKEFDTVHPRVCREHVLIIQSRNSSRGSSPRVQGTQDYQQQATRQWRFIPACAGNTHPADCISGGLPVHPRVCREHSFGKQR